MENHFYTCGGGHFWEDVFFYQKWRIQRNFTTKKCRLLDNWDISRHEGTFEECRKAFIKYIEAYEIGRQKGHMIVMLPGLGESKNIFKPLWRESIKDNQFMAAAVNYPTTQKGIGGHVRQLEFFLNHLEDVDQVSFVTHGIGSIVLRALLTLNSDWKQRMKIGRIVEVQPMNHGSRLLAKLSRNKFFDFVLGPMAGEVTPGKIEQLPQLPRGIETGIILCSSWFTKLAEALTGTKMPYISPEQEKLTSGAKEVVEVRNFKSNIFKNPEICKGIVRFLKDGHF